MRDSNRSVHGAQSCLRGYLLLVSLLFLTACSVPRLEFLDQERAALAPHLKLSSELLVWSPDGQQLVVDQRGLKVFDLPRGTLHDTGIKRFDRIAWGAAGLAVASSENARYQIRLLDHRGDIQQIAAGEGVVVDLGWGQDQTLLILVMRHVYFRFGTNQRSFLLTWRPGSDISEKLLADVTLKPSTLRQLSSSFPFGPRLQISPLGDELVYSRLHDPPAFGASYRVVVRHLATGKERLLGVEKLAGGISVLLSDGESLLFFDGSSRLVRLGLWSDKQAVVQDQAVHFVDAVGDWLYVDGRLYSGPQQVWQLPQAYPAVFSPDGSHLAVSAHKNLYVISTSARVAPPGRSPELLKLRRLRALGLISNDDYQLYRKEL